MTDDDPRYATLQVTLTPGHSNPSQGKLSSVVYSTHRAQLPRNTSNEPEYSTVQLPTVPCNDATYFNIQSIRELPGEPTYATIKSPIMPCDGTAYGRVQNSSNCSDDDDPTYSTVQLHVRPADDSTHP